MYLQQGDCLFFAEAIPAGLDELKDPVVQHGEATGHAHRLAGDGWQMYENPGTKEKFLRIVKPTDLNHEEHRTIVLPPGDYRVGIVREYDHFREEARQVVD